MQHSISRGEVLLSWILISFVFVGVSLLSVPVPGVNEPHYLSKARFYFDPQWCQRDFFLQSGNAHEVFYRIIGPLAARCSLSFTAIVGRIVSLALLAGGWCVLGRRFGLTPAGLISSGCLFCLIAMTGSFSGEWIVGGFESKVPAYGCSLAGVAFWLAPGRTQNNRTCLAAGVLIGIAIAWHPVVGMWFCIGIAISETAIRAFRRLSNSERTDSESSGVTQPAVFLITALVAGLPGLVPAVRLVVTSETSPADQQKANFIQVFWRLAHHLDPSTFPLAAWIHSGLLCVILTGCLLWMRKHNRQGQPSQTEAVGNVDSVWRSWLTLLLTSLLTAVVGVAIAWHRIPAIEMPDWQWRAALLKFYPFRFFDSLLPISTALAASAAVFRVRSRGGNTGAFLLVIGTLLAAGMTRPSAPVGWTAEQFVTWQEACDWLKQNTPADSLVYGPRESFGLKWYAERAEYVCIKDCPQDAAGILEWDRRLWAVYRWSAAAFSDEQFSRSDLRRLRQQTGITHLVTRSLGPFEQEPVWSNQVWRIYELPAADSAQAKSSEPSISVVRIQRPRRD
ncbi:MAG: DUF6798 domain-containing protein [Planctomycetaceae bacterium]